MKIIDSYERFDRIKQDLSSGNVKQQPDLESAERYVNRGNAFARHRNQYDQALSAFNAAIEINPGFAEAYNERGNAYFYQKRYEEAILGYSEAIEIQPEFALGFHNRGSAHAKIGQYDQAISDYMHALSVDPAPHSLLRV